MAVRVRRIYLDSNVFISLMGTELGMRLRGLFVEAELFLERVKRQGCTLVLSELFFREVAKFCYLSKEEVLAYFSKIGVAVEVAEQKGKLPLKEFSGAGLHFSDSLHAAIAVGEKCDCIVTFNIKDFGKIKDKITVLLPDDFG